MKIHHIKTFLLLCILTFFVLSGQVVQATTPVLLDTPVFDLQFPSDGRPASFKTKEDDREHLTTNDPGHSFYLLSRDNVPLRFDRLTFEGEKLVASCGGGLPRVTFGVRRDDSYLALRIERIEAVPASREYSLHFQMKLTQPIKVLELDYMTEARGGIEVVVDWRHIWNRNLENSLGGFYLIMRQYQTHFL